MSLIQKLAWLTLPFYWLPLAALADQTEAEITIGVISEEDAGPSAISNIIALPKQAARQARENARFGQETTQQARTLQQSLGEAAANTARVRGSVALPLPLPLEGQAPSLPVTPIPLPKRP